MQKTHEFPGPELTPLYQAAIFATTGVLPLPGGLPLGAWGVGVPTSSPRGLTALFVFNSWVIPINPASYGVRKCRPAVSVQLPTGAPCLFSFLGTLVTWSLKSSSEAGIRESTGEWTVTSQRPAGDLECPSESFLINFVSIFLDEEHICLGPRRDVWF